MKTADWKTWIAALSGALLAAVPVLATGGAWWVALLAALGAAGTAAVGTETVRTRNRERAAQRIERNREPRDPEPTAAETARDRESPTRPERTVPDARETRPGRAPDRHGRY